MFVWKIPKINGEICSNLKNIEKLLFSCYHGFLSMSFIFAHTKYLKVKMLGRLKA